MRNCPEGLSEGKLNGAAGSAVHYSTPSSLFFLDLMLHSGAEPAHVESVLPQTGIFTHSSVNIKGNSAARIRILVKKRNTTRCHIILDSHKPARATGHLTAAHMNRYFTP